MSFPCSLGIKMVAFVSKCENMISNFLILLSSLKSKLNKLSFPMKIKVSSLLFFFSGFGI